MTHPIENIMRTSMEHIKQLADVNTVIGSPILSEDDTMINTNTVNINVYGAQGQNVRELANEIQTIINNEVYSKGAVFA